MKLGFVAFDSRIVFYTQIYSSTYFYMNVSKHKSLYIQPTFNQKQFYRINSKCMFGSPFGGPKIDSRSVELILTCFVPLK